MSPFDTIFGAIMVGFCALWLIAFVAVATLAWWETWWEDRQTKRRDAAKAAHPASYEASAYTSTPKDAAPAQRCSVPFCDEAVTVHKRVGYETWTFCLEHGLPYLGNEVA